MTTTASPTTAPSEVATGDVPRTAHRGSVTDALLKRLAGLAAVPPGRPTQGSVVPFTGETLGQVPLGTPDDVRDAVDRAREAQTAWAATPFPARARIFLRYHDLVLARQRQLLDLIQLETGKARKNAFEETADVAIVARYYAHTAARHLAPEKRWGALPGLTLTREYHHPRGVIGVISPWNYPFTLAISDAIPALMAGNAVVLKPDIQTSFTALLGAELLAEAGLPPGVFQVVTGEGPELGPPLIDVVDYVSFTGSTATGKMVAKQCAERLIGCSLELGGKNAMVVLDDADVAKTVEGALRGCFSNSGQLCISIERMYVDDAIYDRFVPAFTERVRRMQLAATLDYAADMGSLISQKQFETVTGHVSDAVEKGVTVLAGGKARPDVGPLFFEPTVLADVTPAMKLARDETFGPVVSVYRTSSADDAVAQANDTAYGLNASVWSKDTTRGAEVATRLEAGTANVNEAFIAAWASVDAPMGGMKESGLGRRHGREGIRKYTETQTVAIQRGIPMAAPKGVSEELYAKIMTASLRLMKRLPIIP
ncbi:MAG: succinic semialdehyde dehydrogenase [Actinomycetota bacterium]|nr:succinic semialdehyde dehydrogenase [Actinomycetota bacterium]